MQTIQQKVDAINFSTVVVDDSQLTSMVEMISPSDNFVLVGVIPSIGINGSMDRFKFTESNALFVLKKTDSSGHNHEEFLDIMNETANVMDDVIGVLSELSTSKECKYLATLEASFNSVEPVWLKYGCNGWMLTYNNF